MSWEDTMGSAFERICKAIGVPRFSDPRSVAMAVEVINEKAVQQWEGSQRIADLEKQLSAAEVGRDAALGEVEALKDALGAFSVTEQAWKAAKEKAEAEVERLKGEASRADHGWWRVALEMQNALSPLVPQPPEGYGAAQLANAVALAFHSMQVRLCDDNATDAENALVGIRMALDDLAIRANQTAEGTRSAVEALCVQLRREGRVWTGESLGGLTCPAQLQREDNAALKQRVYTALGERLQRALGEEHTPGSLLGMGEALAQFDLLGRDL